MISITYKIKSSESDGRDCKCKHPDNQILRILTKYYSWPLFLEHMSWMTYNWHFHHSFFLLLLSWTLTRHKTADEGRGPCLFLSTCQKQSLKVFCEKDVLKKFAKFTGKHLNWILFLNKVAGLRPTTLLKKRLQHRCFSVNFAKLSRTTFLQNTSVQLLLKRPRTLIHVLGIMHLRCLPSIPNRSV